MLRGLSNGARELMILIPANDPALFWQIRNFSSARTKPLAEMATNIYLYALDKTTLKSRFKGQSYIVKRDDKIPAGRAVKVARLEYAGNWNPEPGGWKRLTNLMHNTRAVDLDVQPIKLGEGKLSKEFQIAHLTGTVKFRLNPAQRAEIKSFVDAGGTLIVDAAGGVVDFKEAAEFEMGQIFPGAKPGPLPIEHAVYTAAGEKLAQAAYRKYAQRMLVGGMSAPRLRGMEISGRTAVFYSPEDLSVGLVGMSVDGIYGYEPSYANRLMESVIMYGSAGAAPAPAKVVSENKVGDAQPAAATTPKLEDKKPQEIKPNTPPKPQAQPVVKPDPKKAAAMKK